MARALERVHYDKFSVIISPSGFQNLRTYQLAVGKVLRFEITVAARQIDGVNRASFKRVALFYNESGTVQIQGPTWQSEETFKSSNNMDIKFILGVGSITIQVKNASAISTKWNGQTDIILVN
jgi:hypothetical protein